MELDAFLEQEQKRKHCAVCQLPPGILMQVDKALERGASHGMIIRWLRSLNIENMPNEQQMRGHRERRELHREKYGV